VSVFMHARSVVPGDYDVKEAIDLDVQPPVDVVIACSVLQYFPSHEYARRVIERMVSGAKHAVALLDIPDEDTRHDALAYRATSLGGATAYEQRYDGLEHRYFLREWIADTFGNCGLSNIHVEDQDLARYGMAPYRFNAWAFKR
jgi:hypothetical protein